MPNRFTRRRQLLSEIADFREIAFPTPSGTINQFDLASLEMERDAIVRGRVLVDCALVEELGGDDARNLPIGEQSPTKRRAIDELGRRQIPDIAQYHLVLHPWSKHHREKAVFAPHKDMPFPARFGKTQQHRDVRAAVDEKRQDRQ